MCWCDVCRDQSTGDLKIMFWTLGILKWLKQALRGCEATSQLLCLCLSTREGPSQSTSSREVRTVGVKCFYPYQTQKTVFHTFSFFSCYFQAVWFKNIRTSLAPLQHAAGNLRSFTLSATGWLDKQVLPQLRISKIQLWKSGSTLCCINCLFFPHLVLCCVECVFADLLKRI